MADEQAQEDRPVRRLREVLVYDNPLARVFDDEVEFSDRTPGHYIRIESAGDGLGVVVLPLHHGTVGLVRTFRYPIDAWEWGLPRGFSQGADPLVTASRELQEELGVQARDLKVVGVFSPDSGLLARQVAVVLARVENANGHTEDTREVADSRWIELRALWGEVSEGHIGDGMTLSALTLATARGLLPPTTRD